MTNHQIKSLKNEQSTLSINSMFKYLLSPTHNSCFCPNQVVRSAQTSQCNQSAFVSASLHFKETVATDLFWLPLPPCASLLFRWILICVLFFCQTCQIMFDHSFLPDILFCATDVWHIDHYSYVALSFCTLYLRSIVARYCTLCSYYIALQFALGGLHCIVQPVRFCTLDLMQF